MPYISFSSPFKHTVVICRVPKLGHFCGYVGVPEGHPAFGKDLEGVLSVHGGITWCGDQLPSHIRLPEEKLWWFGFDCAHTGDLIPGAGAPCRGDTFKNYNYVSDECYKLSEQLARYPRQVLRSVPDRQVPGAWVDHWEWQALPGEWIIPFHLAMLINPAVRAWKGLCHALRK